MFTHLLLMSYNPRDQPHANHQRLELPVVVVHQSGPVWSLLTTSPPIEDRQHRTTPHSEEATPSSVCLIPPLPSRPRPVPRKTTTATSTILPIPHQQSTTQRLSPPTRSDCLSVLLGLQSRRQRPTCFSPSHHDLEKRERQSFNVQRSDRRTTP